MKGAGSLLIRSSPSLRTFPAVPPPHLLPPLSAPPLVLTLGWVPRIQDLLKLRIVFQHGISAHAPSVLHPGGPRLGSPPVAPVGHEEQAIHVPLGDELGQPLAGLRHKRVIKAQGVRGYATACKGREGRQDMMVPKAG